MLGAPMLSASRNANRPPNCCGPATFWPAEFGRPPPPCVESEASTEEVLAHEQAKKLLDTIMGKVHADILVETLAAAEVRAAKLRTAQWPEQRRHHDHICPRQLLFDSLEQLDQFTS
jgi:hypothetical protein